MDQHDNRTVPGASGHDGQPDSAMEGGQQGRPAPVWGGAPEGRTGAYEPSGRDQSPGQQPAQGWGAPAPGTPSPGWGTTTAGGQADNAGTGWGAPQHYAPDASSRPGKGNWTGRKSLLWEALRWSSAPRPAREPTQPATGLQLPQASTARGRDNLGPVGKAA